MDELMRVEEAAKVLRVSPGTVYRMIRAGELGCVVIGRCVRVRREALEKFIAEHEVADGELIPSLSASE